MKGHFVRKASTIQDLEVKTNRVESPIKVIAEITLSKEDYDFFKYNFFEDYEFIEEHTNNTGREAGGIERCILVKEEGNNKKAIAVNSEGYTYARYAAIVNL